MATDTTIRNTEIAWLTSQLVEPGTLSGFSRRNEECWIGESGTKYDIRAGIPVLLQPTELHAGDLATMEHYDTTPFDVTSPEALESFVAPQFREFVEDIPNDAHVADVGCGYGRNATHLVRRGFTPLLVDQSLHSLQAAQHLLSGVALPVQASNLGLPICSSALDRVVSDGVIHHTTDPEHCFQELMRVLRPGRILFLCVYKQGSYYDVMYNRIGGALRAMKRSGGGWLVDALAVRGFQLAYWFKIRLRPSPWPSPSSYEKARNRFYDYFMVPIARFFRPEDVRALADRHGGEVVHDDMNYGTTGMYLIRKA